MRTRMFLSFTEKGPHGTVKDASGNVIEEQDFPLQGWEEMDFEEKAFVAAQLQEEIAKQVRKNGIAIESESRISRQERRRLEREFSQDGETIETILASMLRNRQLQKAEELVPKINEMGDPISVSEYKRKVETTTNKEIINSYLICSDCNSEFLSYHDAIEAARHSKDIDEWFSMMDHLQSAHLGRG